MYYLHVMLFCPSNLFSIGQCDFHFFLFHCCLGDKSSRVNFDPFLSYLVSSPLAEIIGQYQSEVTPFREHLGHIQTTPPTYTIYTHRANIRQRIQYCKESSSKRAHLCWLDQQLTHCPGTLHLQLRWTPHYWLACPMRDSQGSEHTHKINTVYNVIHYIHITQQMSTNNSGKKVNQTNYSWLNLREFRSQGVKQTHRTVDRHFILQFRRTLGKHREVFRMATGC